MARPTKKLIPYRKAYVLPAIALWTVTSKTGAGVYASSDTLFKGAVFGRDSLEVAEDLLKTKPRLVRKILLSLASLQGQVSNDTNEEELGKIVHEYRNVVVDGKPIDKVQLSIFRQLSRKWGGNETEMAYYGSVDATPHFIKVLGAYCDAQGPSILKAKVTQRDGTTTSMKIVLERATEWLTNHIAASRSGLVEYQRRNPHGIENQVWKDSNEAYVHENKQLANHNAPIASIEVQALAYDAFRVAASLLPDNAPQYLGYAGKLLDRTLELLWLEDCQYFALGTDFDEQENLRVIKTATANPAALLDSEFFDDLPEAERQKYVTAIAKKIMSSDFLTDAGIRSRALSAAHLIDFWDYHGSFVSWPKETYDIAKGLRRQGFLELARELENRLLNVILKSHEYPEFVYVDGTGRVLTKLPSEHTHGELIVVEASNKPEKIQGWTVSAIVAIVSQRMADKLRVGSSSKTAGWQRTAEKHILAHMQRVNRLFNPTALKARYPTYQYRLSNPKD